MAGLLAALEETVSLPLPAITADDERQYHTVAISRLANASVILRALGRRPDMNAAQLCGQAALLREWNAASPVTYQAFRPAEVQA